MARLASPAAGWPVVYLLLSLVCLPANALHFYMQGGHPKCFFEELPKDTLTVGHYEVQQYNADAKEFQADGTVGLYITVDQVFDNDHRIVQQKGEAKGRFTFTAGESGEHKLCFSPTNFKHQAGHLKNGQEVGGVRVSLDIVVGATSNIESTDHGKIQDMVGKVRELQGRLQDIRREQVFQREREAEFRDQSESTNARVVRWTLVQLAVLGVTCAWQLSHLRAFFIKQKLT